MLDFPNSPTVGQVYSAAGVAWVWDSVKWTPASTSGSSFVLPAPSDGQTYVQQNALWVPQAGFAQGFTNKLRNGLFDVWQRGTSLNVAGYTADGWMLAVAGVASLSVNQASPVGLPGLTYNYAVITGASACTGASLHQRIESYIAAPLAGQNCTIQLLFLNNTGAAFAPTLTVVLPTAQDNYASTTTPVNAVAFQSCPNGVWTKIAYTFAMPAGANLGADIWVSFNVLNSNAKTVQITQADLRATPGLPVGLNSAPPPSELRPISEETVFCQRYYEFSSGGGGVCIYSGNVVNTGVYYLTVPYKVFKRSTPSIVLADVANSGFPSGVPSLNATNAWGFIAMKTCNASTGAGLFQFNWTASAEL